MNMPGFNQLPSLLGSERNERKPSSIVCVVSLTAIICRSDIEKKISSSIDCFDAVRRIEHIVRCERGGII